MRLDGMTISRYTHTTSQVSRSRYFFSARLTGGGGGSGLELDDIPLAVTKTIVTGGYQEDNLDDGQERDREENGSQSSQAGIIRATRTFDITEEHVGR